MANAPYLGAATEAAAARREQMRQRLAPTGLSGIDMFRDPGMVAPYLAAAAAAQGPGPFPLALDTGNPPSLLDLIQAANPTRDPRQAMAPGQQGRDPGMLAPYLGPAPRGGPQSMVPGYQAAQPGRPQTNDPGYGASRAMIDDPAYDPSAPPYATSLAAAGAPGGSAGPGSVPGGYVGDPGARPPELNVEGLPWNPAETNVEGLPWLGETEVEGLPWLQGNSEMQALIADLMGGGDAESDKWGALGQGFAAMAESPFFLSGLAKGAGTAIDKMGDAKETALKRQIAGAGLLQGENTQAERVRSAKVTEGQGRERIGLEGQSLEERIRSAKAGERDAALGRSQASANQQSLAEYRRDSLDYQREGLVPADLRMMDALQREPYNLSPAEARAEVLAKKGADQSVYRERQADVDAAYARGELTEAAYLAEKAKIRTGESAASTFEKEKLRIAALAAISNIYVADGPAAAAAIKELDARLDRLFPTPGVPAPTGTPDPGAAAPGDGGGGAAIPGIPGQAATILRSDPSPEAQAEFDSIFGAGAAKAVLGK
jgi:hypothetical protein